MWYSQEKKMTSVVTGGCREVGSSSGGRKNCIRFGGLFVCLFCLILVFSFFFLVKLMLFSLLSVIGYTPVFRESVFCY